MVISVMAAPLPVAAVCSTSLENILAPDREYMGFKSNGQHIWVGQEFETDCDGQFLTVSIFVDVQLVPADGITNLTGGNLLTCTLMDDQNRPIATVGQVLTRAFGLEWVVFNFEFDALGLAAGTLAARISTPQEAYCLVGKSNDTVSGRMMRGTATTLNYVDSRDLAFKVAWDPESGVTPVEKSIWGAVQALFR